MFHRRKVLTPLAILGSILVFYQNCGPIARLKDDEIPLSTLEISSQCSGVDCPTELTTSTRSCSFQRQTILSGGSITAFASAMGNTCLSETRTCRNGELSGSYSYIACSRIETPTPTPERASCLFNGQIIVSGASVTAYRNVSSLPGGTCELETRVCSDGELSGSFLQASCTALAATTQTFQMNFPGACGAASYCALSYWPTATAVLNSGDYWGHAVNLNVVKTLCGAKGLSYVTSFTYRDGGRGEMQASPDGSGAFQNRYHGNKVLKDMTCTNNPEIKAKCPVPYVFKSNVVSYGNDRSILSISDNCVYDASLDPNPQPDASPSDNGGGGGF